MKNKLTQTPNSSPGATTKMAAPFGTFTFDETGRYPVIPSLRLCKLIWIKVSGWACDAFSKLKPAHKHVSIPLGLSPLFLGTTGSRGFRWRRWWRSLWTAHWREIAQSRRPTAASPDWPRIWASGLAAWLYTHRTDEWTSWSGSGSASGSQSADSECALACSSGGTTCNCKSTKRTAV